MYDKFEELNRQTREYNARNVNRFNSSTPKYGTSEYWRNYYNNQTYNTNNGQYNKKFY